MNPIGRKNYRIVDSFENEARNRCVDIVVHDNALHGFQEWRREPEDPGNWSLMCDDGGIGYASAVEATAAACVRVAWFTGHHQEHR